MILVENHQDGGNQSRGRRESYGRLYLVHEAFFGHRNEIVEEVEGGGRSSEFLIVFPGINLSSNIFHIG